MEPPAVLRHGEVTGRGCHSLPHTQPNSSGNLLPVAGDAGTMNGAAATLLLLLLSGRAAFTVCRSLNAPQDGGAPSEDGQMDGTDRLTVTGNGYRPSKSR